MATKKTPFGSNYLNSKFSFRERKQYARNWLTSREASNLIDFWNDELMKKYGRVNLKNQAVRLNQRYLKRLPVPPKTPDHHAVNFVADAFVDLKNYMDGGVKTSRVADAFPKTSKFFDIQVNTQNSWESLDKSYDRHMRGVFKPFTEQYLQIPHYRKKVRTIEDFTEMFLRASRDVGTDLVLTKTGWAESRLSPANFNGLIIEIGGTTKNNHADDLSKSYWIGDPGFKYWVRACRLHGFWVDRNAPWRIIANLNSLKMRQYMAKYKIYNLTDLFETYYHPAHMDDIKDLRSYIFQYWKAFLRFEPEVEVPHYSLGHQQTEINTIQRVDISEYSFDTAYGDLFWIRYWFDMRCYELGVVVGHLERNNIFRTVEKIKKDLDIVAALDYIVSITLKKSGQAFPPEKSFIHRKLDRQVIRKS